MEMIQPITPCLWFDGQAQQAAEFYTSIFKNSRIVQITHYAETGSDIHANMAGKVLMVSFEINGQAFSALNGGPLFKFNEAISLQVFCRDQAEVDYYWQALGEQGDQTAQQCGWLKDKYGVSWQVVPHVFIELIKDANDPKAQRAMEAMMGMKKLDIAALLAAYHGER